MKNGSENESGDGIKREYERGRWEGRVTSEN